MTLFTNCFNRIKHKIINLCCNNQKFRRKIICRKNCTLPFKFNYIMNIAAAMAQAHSFSSLTVADSVIFLVSTILPPILKTSRFSS